MNNGMSGSSNLEPTNSFYNVLDIDSNPVQFSQHADVEMSENQEELEDEDGPPPGWNLILPTSQVAEAVPNGYYLLWSSFDVYFFLFVFMSFTLELRFYLLNLILP